MGTQIAPRDLFLQGFYLMNFLPCFGPFDGLPSDFLDHCHLPLLPLLEIGVHL